jgi:hypothetical protein
MKKIMIVFSVFVMSSAYASEEIATPQGHAQSSAVKAARKKRHELSLSQIFAIRFAVLLADNKKMPSVVRILTWYLAGSGAVFLTRDSSGSVFKGYGDKCITEIAWSAAMTSVCPDDFPTNSKIMNNFLAALASTFGEKMGRHFFNKNRSEVMP